MITKEYINKPAYQLKDIELSSVLFDSVSVVCRMVVSTTKDEAVKWLIENIVLKIIRKQYLKCCAPYSWVQFSDNFIHLQ